MRGILKIILTLLIIAAIGDISKWIYQIGTAPKPHKSVNPYSIYNGFR